MAQKWDLNVADPLEGYIRPLLKLFIVLIIVIIGTFQLSSAQLFNSAKDSTDILFNAPLARILE
jgi:ABC-type enterochelin transport system permease subunit